MFIYRSYIKRLEYKIITQNREITKQTSCRTRWRRPDSIKTKN